MSGAAGDRLEFLVSEFVWSRLLLALMSMLALAVGILFLLANLMAMGPEDRSPQGSIVDLLGIGVCGVVLTILGGQVARWVSGAMGAGMTIGVSWVMFQEAQTGSFRDGYSRTFFLVWFAIVALGAFAVVMAVRGDRRSGQDEFIPAEPKPPPGS